ncbi:MAG: twin-arginine translocase subunit TatC [Planctomycetota bacterium]
MPLGDHLDDLRRRLILAGLGLLPIVVLAFVFGTWLIDTMFQPLYAAQKARGYPPGAQATGPLESFGTYLRVAFAVAIVLGLPWLLYQAWKFVAPGLYAAERRFVYVLAPLSVLLTILSVLFLYFVMLPVVLAFFLGFGKALGELDPGEASPPAGIAYPSVPVLDGDPPSPELGSMWANTRLQQLRIAVPARTAVVDESSESAALAAPAVRVLGVPLGETAGLSQQYRMTEYVRLMFQLAMALSVGFQTPVVVLLLGWAGLIVPEEMGRYRRYAVLAAVVVGAVLTPADPVSMVVLAAPLYLLYEFGLLLCRVLPAERVAGARREGDVDDEGA